MRSRRTFIPLKLTMNNSYWLGHSDRIAKKSKGREVLWNWF